MATNPSSGAEASEAAKVIPGPSEGRPEPMYTGLWKMVSGLSAALAPRGGEGDANTATKLLPYSHYTLALWRFENEAKLDRGGIEWEFFDRRHSQTAEWRGYSICARKLAVDSLQMQPRAVAYTTVDTRSPRRWPILGGSRLAEQRRQAQGSK
jgi:hypothetical protein